MHLKRSAFIAVLLVAAIPAAAEARTFTVDGRVTGPPSARGGAVLVPLQLTQRAGRAMKLGTRHVRVRLNRRARLALSGAGARGATRLAPSALRNGDRLKGVTSLSKKARQRLRRRFRPTLKVRRARVIRAGRRVLAPAPGPGAPGAPGAPAAPRTFEQIVADLGTQATALSLRVGEFGPLGQKIAAQLLQLESLATGIEGVTTSFESLTTALEGLEGTVDEAALEALLLNVEALSVRVEGLEAGLGAVETTLGELEGALSTLASAAESLAPTAAILATQVALIRQIPGAEAQVTALEGTISALNGRLNTAEAALNSFGADVSGLMANMASIANGINALAAAAGSGASLASLSAGVNFIGGGIGGLESGFAGLQATGAALAPTVLSIQADAAVLETSVESLCLLVPTACP
jgi:prefoldin subunit 5